MVVCKVVCMTQNKNGQLALQRQLAVFVLLFGAGEGT
jgi:hypothetical protein